MNFTNRVAMITGASRGIGLAVAEKIAKGQGDVILVDIDEDGLKSAQDKLSAYNVRVMYRVCDVQDEASVNKVVAQSIEYMGHVDILVNNAGIYRSHVVPFIESQSNFWREKININILGTMFFTKAVLPGMLEQHNGRIINIGSVAGYYGKANMVDYSMTKGAVSAFTKALAKEVTSEGVLVNTVSPGTIGTEVETGDFSFLGRAGSPEECAALIGFLASDEASYISGQEYLIDGLRKQM